MQIGSSTCSVTKGNFEFKLAYPRSFIENYCMISWNFSNFLLQFRMYVAVSGVIFFRFKRLCYGCYKSDTILPARRKQFDYIKCFFFSFKLNWISINGFKGSSNNDKRFIVFFKRSSLREIFTLTNPLLMQCNWLRNDCNERFSLRHWLNERLKYFNWQFY